ncbi:Zn-ribbon domain-containing OB-fold protein [Niveispirillum sp. KHB5.9]|uniref:Zn-ribbon domain-containing OB-fold protein n=1 Tax=Niveispirillum sp. KHB5.9 TaxID=3400269 RepID=UPI003A87AD2E
MTDDFSGHVPAIPMIRIGDDGAAFIMGSHCTNCGQTVPGDRMACASCGRRDTIGPVRLATKGTLYNYTIVHRSFPGVKVPFVAAIVDLEGGGSLRGTLVEVEPDPAKLPRDMPISIVFRDTGLTNPDGKRFVSHFFVPAQGEA